MHTSEWVAHAQVIAAQLYRNIEKNTDPDALYLIVTAGGDGTSLEVQTAFAEVVLKNGKKEITDRICFLRLPFGTGNDGADGRTIDVSLKLLTEPVHYVMQPAVRVYPAGKKDDCWYAFNIASIGLDAFVTHMTNRVKHLFPGDFYKIWVDLACVFYDRIYRVGDLSVQAELKDGTVVMNHQEKMLLYLMGVSGHRTYGSGQKILSDDNNICGVRDMSLLRKLKIKKHFLNGTHASFSETLLYTADILKFDYNEKILVQLDGESHLLTKEDFPLTMELTEPFIRILRPEGI
ncbi:hypothetical protein K7I13_01815 [Brucepastera parasyntrophica]|uniref:diacylglycerol/lipid kinase family protein n=1 Tax=Brucepastera parasyntrophica TaxID=2880008 RepID=UPI00210A1561|nr:diacylglycerol kinase family protein [Brucepastera parasyntrophica]ULQ60090.1 hypothetical protein K7I13_01815 [Brucepastera parasyntrophica]